ncbi:MAG: HEAT repeat domain-containing protein [Desulfobacteraceae bacterium]|jgi:hypothetical protein
MGTRALKKTLLHLLEQPVSGPQLEKFCALPLRQVINPLFSFFYSKEEHIRWHAITAMGAVTSRMAAFEMEHARIVMRRLMWNLNDESGGIGWGSPEAMAEIMARCVPLAYEYASILVSYADPNGNFIEHDKLQRGVLWGLGRLAQVHPAHVADAAPFLTAYLTAPDPYLRGLATWAAGHIKAPFLTDTISALTRDSSEILIFADFELFQISVFQLAQQALSKISESTIT